jgi:signal transduction histidine kinase
MRPANSDALAEAVTDELHRLIQQIASGLSLDDALTGVLLAVERLCDVDSSSILLARPDGSVDRRRFTTRHTGQPHWDDHGQVRDDGVTIAVLRTGEAVAIEDTFEDDRTRYIARPDRRSVAAVPLRHAHGTLGVLYVNWRDRHPCSPGELDLLETLATYGAIAIENARMLQRESEARREAEEAHQKLRRFLGLVAHDLEGPLTMVVAYAELLRLCSSDDSFQVIQETVPGIHQAARRIQRLVTDLLVVGQITGDELVLEPRRVDLVRLLREVIEQQYELSRRHRLVLSAPASLSGDWDAARLRQVFANLIANAVRYSGEGGDVLVSVHDGEDQEVAVSIADQGVGISGDQLASLFRPFTRLDREPTTDGVGLGLYIAKAIVERHHGRIWVESTPGRGSTFWVALPRGQTARAPADDEQRRMA